MAEDEAQTFMENTGRSPTPARGISRGAARRGAANTCAMMRRVAAEAARSDASPTHARQ
jgi:hypothetical protein